MNDQASTLRFIASTTGLKPPTLATTIDTEAAHAGKTRYIAVTSGKGGVGKTNLTVNLALELGTLGKQVALLDADFGLGNADILCGISPKYHLGHAIKGLKDFDDITVPLGENVRLIPGGSGDEDLANLSFATHSYLFTKLRAMEEKLDFMLIDTAPGVAESVIGILISAAEVLVIVTPEPSSIVDAYATIKVLLRHSPAKRVSVVVNNVRSIGDAERVFQQLDSAVQNFLQNRINFLGVIPHDPELPEAVRAQTPVTAYAPQSPASRSIRLIARQLYKQSATVQGAFPVESFWSILTGN